MGRTENKSRDEKRLEDLRKWVNLSIENEEDDDLIRHYE